MARFAEALGTAAPDPHDVDVLLELAGTAAHASERTAAPLTTWLAGRAGVTAADALAVARQLAGARAGEEGGGGPAHPAEPARE